jgi:3-hydroxyacyl-CoA dehydrogenase/enoyl-CoA hydratase/3-hydroxybutyryl-CoA epimerase
MGLAEAEESIMSNAHWHYETDSADIGWLTVDKSDSSANVLSGPVLAELDEILERLESKLPAGVIVHSGKAGGFIMGADIKEFTKIEGAQQAYELVRRGQQVLDRLEALPCPTVAVIEGHALGGGLELAMACDYRIAVDSDKRILGLPEVQLGIHPGFGGTVRTVRLCGVRPAMELMLTGNPVDPGKAARIGLVDRVIGADAWRSTAREFVTNRPARQSAPWQEKLLGFAPLRPLVANVLRKQVAGKARREHYPAPWAIIDLWARYGAQGARAYDAEARSIAELMCTPTSRNLVRVYFLQNRLKNQAADATAAIRHVHVVGAGVMGGDIASWCALQGMTVTLQDREMKYIEPALDRARKLFDKRVRDEKERAATTARLSADVEGRGVADADLVIEAIFEDLDAKQGLYRSLQPGLKADAMLATNTSSIRLEDLRTVLDAPERFIGLHFFNPVAKLPLVELIRCADTSRPVLDRGLAFVRKIGKLPLECASAPGFLVNRILAPYTNEALLMAADGISLREIDKSAVRFGMPMGPIELLDSVGIDVALHVARLLGAAFGRPVPALLQSMVAEKRLGRKSGRGFYQWEDGQAIKPEEGRPAPADAEDRLILPMLNEAVACLHEGVVDDADLLDAGVIFGTGFAPFRGGPLHYAKACGVSDIVTRLTALEAAYGERFAPHAGWETLSR